MLNISIRYYFIIQHLCWPHSVWWQVWTELVQCGQYEFGKQGRFFINAIAETPDTVAEDLVPKIRKFVAAPGKTASSVRNNCVIQSEVRKSLFCKLRMFEQIFSFDYCLIIKVNSLGRITFSRRVMLNCPKGFCLAVYIDTDTMFAVACHHY